MSLVAAMLGWLRGENLPKSKTRSASVTSQGCVLQKFAKRRAQVEFREGRELWYTCMADAETFEEWVTAAQRLDEIEGHVEWKAFDTSPSYDSKLLRERIRQVQHMVAHESMPGIVDWLRGGLQRNFVGSGNSELFDHTHCGTKTLIERHNCEMTRLLFEVANCREDAMSLEKRLAFFTEARHALGKSALLLSGGLGLGMYHLGVVRALHEQHLLPRVISASSFGAVVAVVVGASTVDELSHMFESMFEPDDNICSHLHAAQQDRFDVKIRRLLSTGLLFPPHNPPPSPQGKCCSRAMYFRASGARPLVARGASSARRLAPTGIGQNTHIEMHRHARNWLPHLLPFLA